MRAQDTSASRSLPGCNFSLSIRPLQHMVLTYHLVAPVQLPKESVSHLTAVRYSPHPYNWSQRKLDVFSMMCVPFFREDCDSPFQVLGAVPAFVLGSTLAAPANAFQVTLPPPRPAACPVAAPTDAGYHAPRYPRGSCRAVRAQWRPTRSFRFHPSAPEFSQLHLL